MTHRRTGLLLSCCLLLLAACASPTTPPPTASPTATAVPPTATPIPPTPTATPEPDLTQADLWAAGFTTVVNRADAFVIRKGDVTLDLSLLATEGDPQIPPALNQLRLHAALLEQFEALSPVRLRADAASAAARYVYTIEEGALLESRSAVSYTVGTLLFPVDGALVPAVLASTDEIVRWAEDGASIEHLKLAGIETGEFVWTLEAVAEAPAWTWEELATPITYPLTAEELETVTAMLEPETALPPVRFFETAPFNTVDEVEAVLGAENYTRAMEVQIPDGPKLIVLVDDVESPYRIRQIDYMPDGPDGQPANEELAQILLAQMLSVQQQANAIGSDGRLAPSTAPEPGEEELSVMDFALARDDHDPEQVLAPELARVNLPVNSPRIETVIFASVKNQTQDKENAYVELGDGTRLKLHIHGGATDEHSYAGLGLAELPDGGLVLICFISTPRSPQDKYPLSAALAPLNTGLVAVEMGALHPDIIARHYYVIGTANNPPIVTQDIRQIRPANDASYLKDMAPKVMGQR